MNQKIKVEHWIGIFTVIVSIIALFLSWQANKVVSQQSSARVVAFDASWNGGGFRHTGSGQQATCVHVFRLSNLGGVPTALTGYKIRISFEDSRLNFENSFPVTVKPDALTPMIGSFEVYFFPAQIQIDFPSPFDSHLLQFPFEIGAYTTVDIQTALNFNYDSSLSLESARYNESKSYWYNPSILEDYTPISIHYVFNTSSGQEISVPELSCWYVK